MPSINQSYAGRDAGIYFFKPALSLPIVACAPLLKQGYKFYFTKVDKHVHIVMLKAVK